MTRYIEFLARELGRVVVEVSPCARGGYAVLLGARDGSSSVADAASAADAIAEAARIATAKHATRVRAELAHAESQAEAAREALAAIAEMEEG